MLHILFVGALIGLTKYVYYTQVKKVKEDKKWLHLALGYILVYITFFTVVAISV